MVDESVQFKSVRKQTDRLEDDREDENDARATTDEKGRFSIKVLKGSRGTLIGSMYTYVGEFENCPKLDRLIQQSKKQITDITTAPVELQATTNLYGVELKFGFPWCKKAKTPEE